MALNEAQMRLNGTHMTLNEAKWDPYDPNCRYLPPSPSSLSPSVPRHRTVARQPVARQRARYSCQSDTGAKEIGLNLNINSGYSRDLGVPLETSGYL